ncbi:MAG TPA: hypothetical protein VFV70_12770 [Hyphomonadaceae bacterium]|nr:hypothetical protein [Hyphomonadaceae bacterium]
MARQVESKVTKSATPKVVEHGLPPYLASDEAIIHALNRYPAGLVDANGRVSLGFDETGHADGEGVLDAIKAGKLSVTLRNVEQAHPGLWAEAVASFGRFGRNIGIRNPGKLSGQLILSSSDASAPVDFACTGIVMFHLRGVKRVWVYPAEEAFLPQTTLEAVVAGGAADLGASPLQDAAAWRFDLVPGEALAAPFYAPHRVENQEGLCVTLVLTFETAESRATNGAHAANSVLRRWGRKIARMEKTPFVARAALAAVAVAFRLTGLAKKRPTRIVREFVTSEPAAQTAAETRLAA